MKQIILIMSLTLGLASPAFAIERAGTVLAKGQILDKEYKSYQEDDGKTIPYWNILVAHGRTLYECRVYPVQFDVECTSFEDRGAY